MEDNQATGVRVKMDGSAAAFEVKAKAVVCNADMWNTMKLIPPGISAEFDGENFRDLPGYCNCTFLR